MSPTNNFFFLMKNKCLFKKFYLTLQYCIGFAIYQNESATGIHVFPILNPPPSSLLSPHTIPLGRPSAPDPSIQYRASNLDWQIFFAEGFCYSREGGVTMKDFNAFLDMIIYKNWVHNVAPESV